ncbi:MAG: methyltransferase [Myxococcota bacterium]
MKWSLMYRPEPIERHAAEPVDRSVPPRQAAARLRDGGVLMVTDHYSTGAEILAQLASIDRPPPDHAGYQARQEFQRRHRLAALRLLAPIKNHRLALVDARPIGFLEELYPEVSDFVLPFLVVQELHGAWIRYQQGTHLAVLGHRVHPFFGTYVPTRTSHLELFGTWMSQYKGAKGQAVDVGTGCGVLALMLAKAGFERVLATDSNPNAIESVKRQLERLPTTPSIELAHGDLLCETDSPADLIVFNPPWIYGQVEDLLDQALYFEEGLFERFFQQAAAHLKSDGRVVIVFSNVNQLVQPHVPHPILAEIERGRFSLVQKLQRKVKPTPGKGGVRRRTKEKVEVWELAKVQND